MVLADAMDPKWAKGRRYVRPPVALHFPTDETVPESEQHFLQRVLLYQSVRRELQGRALIASDQFLYWDPTDPRQCLAPDLAIRRGDRGPLLKSWKTWERGAPEVGVEIASDSDSTKRELTNKLERYRRAGIAEVVRIEVENEREPLRLWDFIDGDLVERALNHPEARRCDALGLYWCVCNHPELGRILRLARDAEGVALVLTAEEAERAAKESERAARESERAAREDALAAKEAALARVVELEAELARRTRTDR